MTSASLSSRRLSPFDVAHMRKVNGCIARHLKQRPKKSGDGLRETDWLMSLKKWGHEPLR